MNSRDFELIALGHVLTRYRLTGALPNINGQPFELSAFKEKLFQGVNSDSDININIDTLKTESNVTIVDNCEHDTPTASAVPPAQTEPPVEEKNNNTETPANTVTDNNTGPGGRLFQYFR